MVCLSGGKDCYAHLGVLLSLRQHAPSTSRSSRSTSIRSTRFPRGGAARYLAAVGVQYRIIEQDTYSVVKRVIPEGKTMCSRQPRRACGALYRVARRSATRIALGHHRDDILQTFSSISFTADGSRRCRPLVSDDGAHIVIRPLAYCKEQDLRNTPDPRSRSSPAISAGRRKTWHRVVKKT